MKRIVLRPKGNVWKKNTFSNVKKHSLICEIKNFSFLGHFYFQRFLLCYIQLQCLDFIHKHNKHELDQEHMESWV